jgi:hypothetical protein
MAANMETVSHITKFGQTALKAMELIGRGYEPRDAWRSAAISIFPNSPESQNKRCPKGAFLGLASAGHLAGAPAGDYTTSVDNKRYAIDAMRLLQRYPELANVPDELWRRVMRSTHKQHNDQMGVVVALWKHEKFVCQQRAGQT